MNVRKILVAYDGSSPAKAAFHTALDLATVFGAKITVVSCIDVYASGWLGKSSFENKVLKKLRGKIMNEIKKLEMVAKKNNIEVTGRIFETASIINTITQFASKGKFDLIVIGSHGRTGIKRALLGSISYGVIQHSSIPVIVVRSR